MALNTEIYKVSLEELEKTIYDPCAVIIDDDDEGLLNLERKLETEGYKISLFNSLEDLKKTDLKQYYAPLCIIDLNLGTRVHNEGIHVCKIIKESIPNSCCIAYTADPNSLDSFEEKNFDYILEKIAPSLDSKKIIQSYEKHINHLFVNLSNEFKNECDLFDSKLAELKSSLFSKSSSFSPDSLNNIAYNKHRNNSKWLNDNLGYYVAFIDGVLFEDRDVDEILLAKKISSFTCYKQKSKLIVKVTENFLDKPSMRMPSSLWVKTSSFT